MNTLDKINGDKNLRKRFESKIDKSGDCWIWLGHVTPNGYGQIKTKRYDGKPASLVASRYALFLATNKWPESYIHACHTCDNRKCVNPEHLFWGDSLANQLDCLEKNRRPKPYKDWDEARIIRAELRKTKNYAEIAIISQKYGIYHSHEMSEKQGDLRALIPWGGEAYILGPHLWITFMLLITLSGGAPVTGTASEAVSVT